MTPHYRKKQTEDGWQVEWYNHFLGCYTLLNEGLTEQEATKSVNSSCDGKGLPFWIDNRKSEYNKKEKNPEDWTWSDYVNSARRFA